MASVAGSEFTAFAVAGGGMDQASVEDCCDSLAQRQLLLRNVGLVELPDGSVTGVYQFTHSLYREVLYRECSQTAKVRLHQRIGQALEELWKGEVEIASELARHFQEGRDYARAVRYLRLAAENAVQRCAYREAVAILETAMEAAARLPESTRREAELGVLGQLVEVQNSLGDEAKAKELHETLVERAAAVGQTETTVANQAESAVVGQAETTVVGQAEVAAVSQPEVAVVGHSGVAARPHLSLSNVVKWIDGPRSLKLAGASR